MRTLDLEVCEDVVMLDTWCCLLLVGLDVCARVGCSFIWSSRMEKERDCAAYFFTFPYYHSRGRLPDQTHPTLLFVMPFSFSR